ncbi:MAG TPA: hypothetical protein VIA62_22810 [Thermoanaerobaculia bacterium]|jgi:hypothetical protein|nr:hypothetical protein [Thermoanaerobaculia bacterium]
MDDSERTYGYSEDIYHGSRHGRDAEKSYEYGPENRGGEAEGSELSPEEEAIHIEGPRDEEPVPAAEAREYDYGREGGSDGAAVESFTWDLEPEEAHAGTEKDRKP